ncbi:MAG: type II secretion system protein [Bacteroidota bacterium]
MNEKILDAHFHNAFSDYLEKGEKIVWEGEPDNKLSSLELLVVITIIAFVAINMSNPKNRVTIIVAMVFVLIISLSIIIPMLITWRRKKNTKYLLTNRQVLFQIHEKGKVKIHSLLINDIARVNAITNSLDDTLGDIFLIPKSNKKTFTTYTFENGKETEVPVIQQIKNPREVKKWIAEMIQF